MPDHDSPPADRDLVRALTAAALEVAAPEELVVLEETAAEFFADRRALLHPKDRDDPVGFGIDVGLIAPYVLAVATPVVKFLLDTVAGAAEDAAKPMVVDAARRLIRRPRGGPDGDGTVPLTLDQVRHARAIAYDEARRLGLAEDQCLLLADSVAGGLVSP
jgi:hypothetical protein